MSRSWDIIDVLVAVLDLTLGSRLLWSLFSVLTYIGVDKMIFSAGIETTTLIFTIIGSLIGAFGILAVVYMTKLWGWRLKSAKRTNNKYIQALEDGDAEADIAVPDYEFSKRYLCALGLSTAVTVGLTSIVVLIGGYYLSGWMDMVIYDEVYAVVAILIAVRMALYLDEHFVHPVADGRGEKALFEIEQANSEDLKAKFQEFRDDKLGKPADAVPGLNADALNALKQIIDNLAGQNKQ